MVAKPTSQEGQMSASRKCYDFNSGVNFLLPIENIKHYTLQRDLLHYTYNKDCTLYD